MKSVVTGCAGFIGSHLCEALLSAGHEVVGIDCFTDYYPRKLKEANMAGFAGNPKFRFFEIDIDQMGKGSKGLKALEAIKDADFVFHQAAQAGVRASWGEDFRHYTLNTFEATQRMLEIAKGMPNLKKFVFASSSSVYGELGGKQADDCSDKELWPISPYGVSKLASEKLCRLYHESFRIPVIVLRYFTVYGPRQRPDMGIQKFIAAVLEGREIDVYGDGEQTRDFTYVSDVVSANIMSASCKEDYAVINIAGGSKASVNEVIKLISDAAGKKAKTKRCKTEMGDVKHTSASTEKARKILGWTPKVGLEEGIRKQVEWNKGSVKV